MPLPSWMNGINDIQNRMGQGDPFEGGIDFGTNKIGVPFEALNDGTIVGAGYFCHGGPYFMTSPTGGGVCGDPGYGVVTIRMDTPFGPQDVYYQHINIDSSITLCSGNCPGQHVRKGQIIGTGGVGNPPQNLLEMGVNVPWGSIWGTNHPGPWVDPEQILRSLINNYGSNTTSFTGTGPGGTTGTTSGGVDPLSAVNSFFGALGGLLDWLKNPVRLVKMAVGIMLIGIALVLLMAPSYGEAFQKAFTTAKKHPEMFA